MLDRETPDAAWDRLFADDSILGHPAFDLPGDTVIGIAAAAHFRKDSTQVIFYGADLFDLWMFRLNSAQVVALSLFNGIRTLDDVAQCIADLADCNIEAAEVKVRRFLCWLDFPNAQYGLVDVGRNPGAAVRVVSPEPLLISDSKRLVRLDKPVSLMLMPTDKCFTDCEYCYACRRKIDPNALLPIPRILELVSEAADLGVININLDGGDLLARDGHLEILAHIHSEGIVAGISTKGFVSKRHAAALYDAGVRWVQVGLDSIEPVGNKLVNRRGYVRRAIEAIRNLAEANINVRTNSIIVSDSLAYLPQLIDLLMTLPLVNVKIAPAFGSAYRGTPDLLLDSRQKDWFRQQMSLAAEKYPSRKGDINWECKDDTLDLSREQAAERFHARPMCSSGRSQIVIAPDGKVVTCEMSPQDGDFVVGDCTHQTIMEVWNSEELKQWWNPPRSRFNGTPCDDCPEFHDCIGATGQCWFRAFSTYGTPYAPHPDCRRAERPSRRWE